MAEAGRMAERAITLDPQDAKALTIAGHVRAFLHHRMREAIALHERALMLNPNLAMAWNLSMGPQRWSCWRHQPAATWIRASASSGCRRRSLNSMGYNRRWQPWPNGVPIWQSKTTRGCGRPPCAPVKLCACASAASQACRWM
jgi:hypothetical protein